MNLFWIGVITGINIATMTVNLYLTFVGVG